MADWSNLVRKHREDDLEDGEEVLCSLLTLPRGGLRKVAIAGGVGGAIGSAGTAAGMRVGGDRAVRDAEAARDGTTMAGSFPVGFLLVTITDRRVLVFDRGSAAGKRPQRLAAVFPPRAITGMTSSKGFLKRDVTLMFSDGSTLDLDGGVGQPYDRFGELLSA